MIRLTMIEGDALYVSPELITGVYDGGEATSLFIGGEEAFSVRESPQEVARKVLEYKFDMELFKNYLQAWMTEQRPDWKEDHYNGLVFTRDKIKRLAGLEDINDV